MQLISALACAFLVGQASAFSVSRVRSFGRSSLKAATGGPNEEAIKAIREKMAADPSYNPMADPQAMQVIDSMIPDAMREVPNAIERLKVAFKDATSGQDSVSDINSLPSTMSMSEAISSPQSKWFKEKFPVDAFNQAEKDDLKKKIKAKYPEVPAP